MNTFKETGKAVYKGLLNSFPKCRDKYPTDKSIKRLLSLFQITLFKGRMKKKTMRFLNMLKCVEIEESEAEDSWSRKLRLHARITM